MAPATAVLAERRGTALTFVTVLSAGSTTPPTVEQVPVEVPGRIVLDVTIDGTTERVLMSPTAVSFPAI